MADHQHILMGTKRPWLKHLIDTDYKFIKYKDIKLFFQFCKNNKIKILFPFTVRDELFINEHKTILRQKKYRFLVPSSKNIKILNNKSEFVKFMIKNGLSEYIPTRYNSIRYPCILKKNKSVYGKDSYVINSKDDIPKNIDLKEYLIQEPIQGKCEYSTDLLAKNGKIIKWSATKYCYDNNLYIMGHKLISPTIHVDITQPVYDAFVSIIKTLNYDGFCNVDYKIVESGYPKIFEINPRCGGSLKDISMNQFNEFVTEYVELCK